MSEKQEQIAHDQLFIGLALPPTLLGAPYGFAVGALMLSGIFFVMIKNPFALLVGVPVILIGRLITKYDPYGVQAIKQRMVLRSRLTLSGLSWKANGRNVITVSPWEYHTGNINKRKKKRIK